MQASSQNQLAAYYMGIPVKRVHSLIWALSGMTAAVAGILFASKGSIDPSVGLLGIKAFAAAVIGGFGSLPGALLGGIIIGVIEPFAGRYMPPPPLGLRADHAVSAPVPDPGLPSARILAQVHAKKV